MSVIPTRFGLRGKLLAGSAVLLAFTGTVGAFGISDIKSANDEADRLYSQAVVPLSELGTARAKFNENRAFVNNHTLETSAAAKAEVEAKINKNVATIDSNLARVEPTLAGDAQLQDQFKTLVAQIATYREARNQVIGLSNANKTQEAYAVNKAEAIPAAANVAGSFTTLFEAKVAAGKTAHEHIQASASAATTRALLVILAAIAVGFALALWFARRITRTVNEVLNRLQLLRDHCTADLAAALGRVAEGDLTVPVQPITPELHRTSNDEIGDVAEAVGAIRNATVRSVDAYNAMRAQLADTVAEMAVQAATVASASQQMAATSEETGRAVSEIAAAVTEVAHGAERQVRGVEVAREAVQQASASAATSAEVATHTARAAEDARGVALEGVDAAESASAAMREVAESSAAVGSAIGELNARSERIGGIVGTITGLAEQTNLLALNAAIEAARAGEQGRGFAVVAEEVRKLAEESQSAASEISALIGEMQAETSRVVGVVSDGTQRTQDGVATVERTREAFEAIGTAVEDMTARVGEITTAVDQISAEASRAESEVVDVAAVAEESSASVEQVSASTQQTSASAQEIAASAQTLSATAEHLNSLVARFTVSAA
ncbi:methyl-accepting chemotaxis protein [Solirubrobacter pauli]|uniref:Methyl-accepting chemotaxis protein n=1 Tax=Solirubrobacter pauli TaxID=166793 RepID=A0A660L252_9ACTN|nr:methyl-accepting chemotaxis protein [Solirubrobacter pauli]RKQ86999.1 methyl-accepting chemotaxis protein [Solirubrobacter pauli]